MNYKLDMYGNLINGEGETPSVFSIKNKPRTLRHQTSITTLSQPSSPLQPDNQCVPLEAEYLSDWIKHGDELIENWESEGNKRIIDWENDGNIKMNDWKKQVETHLSAFWISPPPLVLPATPTSPVYVSIHDRELSYTERKEADRRWRMIKEEIKASWNQRKIKIKRAWSVERDEFINLHKKR